jgi:hypothetical protein
MKFSVLVFLLFSIAVCAQQSSDPQNALNQNAVNNRGWYFEVAKFPKDEYKAKFEVRVYLTSAYQGNRGGGILRGLGYAYLNPTDAERVEALENRPNEICENFERVNWLFQDRASNDTSMLCLTDAMRDDYMMSLFLRAVDDHEKKFPDH